MSYSTGAAKVFGRRDGGLWGLAALFCGMFASALLRSPWWFVAIGSGLWAALWVLRKSVLAEAAPATHASATRRLDSGTVFSLVLYAALASVILITLRAAMGWLERPALPFDQMSLPEYMQGSVLGFYDKSEMRLALYEMLAFTSLLGLAFVHAADLFVLRYRRPFSLRAETAAFAIVLYFAAAYSPPYIHFNLPHWFPFIAGATAIQNGVWPYFSGFDFSYGLLCLGFLSAWVSLFGLSTLSLSTLLMLSDLLCGLGVFVLIRRLTGSHAVALLGAAFLLLEGTDTVAVTSTFRAPIQIILGSLLLYSSLHRVKHRIRNGFLFGITVLWNPTFGAFAAAGFAFAHAYRLFSAPREERLTHLTAMVSMLAGIIAPLLILWLYSGPAASRLADFYAGSGGNLFLLGYANLAQKFDTFAMAACLLAVLYLALVLYRSTRSRKMTARSLFVGASLITAIPYVIYAIGRSDISHQFAAYWALLPSMALLFYGLVRLLSLRRGPFTLRRPAIEKRIGLTTVALGIAFVAFFPLNRLITSIAGYTTGNESLKQKWYTDCAAGKSCDVGSKPTLRNHLLLAGQPLLRIDPGLAAACRGGTDILSYNDALFYAAGHCFSPIGLPTVNLLVTRQEIDWYVNRVKSKQQILFDTGTNAFAEWKGDMLGELKARLIAQGFSESAACKGLTILSKGDPRPLARRICG